MKATINGRTRELPNELTFSELLAILGSPAAGIAVARNDRVVHRTHFESTAVREGDRIEIIAAVAGG